MNKILKENGAHERSMQFVPPSIAPFILSSHNSASRWSLLGARSSMPSERSTESVHFDQDMEAGGSRGVGR